MLEKLLGPACKCTIRFSDEDKRKKLDITRETSRGPKTESMFVFTGDDPVRGSVVLEPQTPGKKIEYLSIELKLLGEIVIYFDSRESYEFSSLVKMLAPTPGEFASQIEFPFEFTIVDKPYESYNGINTRLRYFLQVTIHRNYLSGGDIVQKHDFWVLNKEPTNSPLLAIPDSPIKMEVGIEQCLHIEFEYNKNKYHLRDVVRGKIVFRLIKIKIKHMEMAIIKRESTGAGINMYSESETVTKFEVMDGCPTDGETIPVRLHLSGWFNKLTPTYRHINNKFSVKYYLNLVLVDEEDRRYYKQQEIQLYRKDL